MRDWLRKARTARGMTQQEGAVAMGITRSYYCLIENSKKTPAPQLAIKIAEYLGVEWSRFYEG